MCTTANLINFDEYFEKKYLFKSNDDWNLPEESDVFTKERWSIPILQNKKNELNGVKSQLNDYNLEKWSKHTKSRDPSGAIMNLLKKSVQPELLTQAWCKFYECLSHYSIIPLTNVTLVGQLSSLHLCEAPGAFICALNHKLNLDQINVQWKWISTTLNPDYEGNNLQTMIPDDRFIMHTSKNWHFGCDLSGDITRFYNYESLLKASQSLHKIMIVTADGSVDCMEDPGSQESIVEYLHYCETMTALTVLEKGGSFVIKIFTMFEDSTICLLYLLNCCFEQVNVFKPCTSKSGNSEVYVICLLYKGINALERILPSLLLPYAAKHKQNKFAMFPLEKIPGAFIDQIVSCSEYFMQKQIRTISENIKHFENNDFNEHRRICHLKADIARNFSWIYRIEKIESGSRIVPLHNISNYVSCYFCKQWNATNKWSSAEDTICLRSKSLAFDFEQMCDCKLQIAKGKIVKELLHSKFCARDNFKGLIDFVKTKRPETDIFHPDAIRIADVDYANAADFDKTLFSLIRNRLLTKPATLALVKIPLLTNFLCGVVYLLSLAFETLSFSSQGTITFDAFCNHSSVDRYFDEINDCLIDLRRNANDERDSFQSDVLQVVPPSLLNRKSFYDSVWQYNNRLAEIHNEKS